MNRFFHFQVLIVAACLGLGASSGSAMTGLEIMKEKEERHRSDSEYSRSKMTLVSRSGQTKERTVHSWGMGEESGVRRSMMKFSEPTDIRNVGLLTWEGEGNLEDDQWLFLPADRRVKRVTGGSKKRLFMGTDLAFEDMRPEDLSVHRYDIHGEEEVDGMLCWVIDAYPTGETEKKTSGYTRRRKWIDQEMLRVVKTEFYGRGDRLIKTGRVTEWEHVKDAMWRAKRSEIHRYSSRTKTIIELTELQVDQGVEQALLTQTGLMRPISLR